jgi:hypothetical protein
MMKQFVLVFVLAVVVLVVCLAGRSIIIEKNKTQSRERELKEYEATLELVKDINQNSDFCGAELLKFSERIGQNQHSEGDNDISPETEITAAGKGVRGYYFNYPIDSNDYRLTQISITVAPYHVYGITVEKNINDVTPVLEEKGFTKFKNESLYDDIDMITYRQHHVSIFLDVFKDTGIIRTITVSVYDK